MKNFKKIAAFGIAAAMTMSMGVSAFAEVAASSTDTKFGSYTGGVAKLANTKMLDTTHQWTVVIIDKDKETANLTADDLYYINQGTGSEDFWVTNGMGTKVDLTTLVSESTPTKNFIIRIGGETISDTTGIIEIPFVINYNSGEPSYILGDSDGDGLIKISDATLIVDYILGFKSEADIDLLAADCDGVEGVKIGDATAVVDYILGFNTLPPKK